MFQCSVVRREARAREFVVVARLTVFKQATVGKPNARNLFMRRGAKFTALVTATRPETR
jgi:hypothetical protein